MLRRIPLGAMMNLRDLGGYPTVDGRETKWERLLRGDVPEGLSEQDIRWLLDRNITTVIDLRSGPEVERQPDQLSATSGFTYFHISLEGGDVLPVLESNMPKGYFDMLDEQTCMREVMRHIASAPDGVLFHCAAGKDRTGCTAALLLLLCRVPLVDVVADYQVSETYLQEIIRRLRKERPDAPAHLGRSRAEYMEETLALLMEKYGRLEDYLRAIGLTDEELNLLRRKLLE